WQECGGLKDGLDLSDHVKGRRQYWLRFHTGAEVLKEADLKIVTVCQANASTMPRLTDKGSRVTFRASNQAVLSVGPNLPQAEAHAVEGKFGSPAVTREVATPPREPIVAVHAAAHVQSGSPPDPDVKYQIELSTDGGKSWKPIAKDWTITRQGDEPGDF